MIGLPLAVESSEVEGSEPGRTLSSTPESIRNWQPWRESFWKSKLEFEDLVSSSMLTGRLRFLAWETKNRGPYTSELGNQSCDDRNIEQELVDVVSAVVAVVS